MLLAAKYPHLVPNVIAAGPNVTPDGLKPWFIRLTKIGYFFTRSDLLKLMLTEPHISADTLHKISAPTAILGGSHDIVKTEHLHYIADNVSNSVCEIIRGEGHASYVVNMPKFYEIIKKYL